MKEILLQIFAHYGYERIISKDGIIVLQHRQLSDYWIIKDYSDNLMDNQRNIRKLILSERIFDEKIDKNLSMLVLMEKTEISEEIHQLEIAIEDNQEYFKKYVIVYTPQDLNEFRNIIDLPQFSEFLMNSENFNCLKRESSETDKIGPFHLAYTLAHKLPFVMTNIKHKSSEGLVNHFSPKTPEQNYLYNWALNANLNSIEKEITKLARNMK